MKKYAFIPAAGGSTRLRELGKQYAKTVLPFEGKPIIEHIIGDLVVGQQVGSIIIATSTSVHAEQLEEATRHLVSTSLEITVVIIDDTVGVLNRGPAKTIIDGLRQYERESGVLFEEGDSVVIHLSDSLFNVSDVTRIMPDEVGFGILPDEEDHSRWCMVDISPNNDHVVFYDKPTERPNTKQVASGLYHLSSIVDLLNIRQESFPPGESQISVMLSLYQQKHKLAPTEAPIRKDFGTIEEYIANRGVSKSRSFNIIKEIGSRHIEKSSRFNPDKVIGEGLFMRNQHQELAQYYPVVTNIDTLGGAITMEKVRSTNLRDLYLYMDRSKNTWDEVFGSVVDFNIACRRRTCTGEFWGGVVKKTSSRIVDRFDTSEVRKFMNKLIDQIGNYSGRSQVTAFHGDLHFANMFYCFTYKDLKLIDPRGDFRGHWLYDVAKLNHSVVGKYDWIDSELYTDRGVFDNGASSVIDSFEKFKDDIEMTKEERKLLPSLTASLFLSMIPLHGHSTKNQELYYEEFLRFSK